MFVIITYDAEVTRINKIRKLLKKYLTWTQNSVFEGEISEGNFNKCISELGKIIIKREDSIYVYVVKNPQNIKKKICGVQKSFDDMFI